jgi:hypothetical protein
MVEWLEAARGIAVDLLKLVLFWFAESHHGYHQKPGKVDSDLGEGGVCFAQLAKTVFCEKEKEDFHSALKECESQSSIHIFVGGFLAGGLFVGLVIAVISRLVSRVIVTRGQAVEVCPPVAKKLKIALPSSGEDTDSDVGGEVFAARLRARALRG